MTKVVRPTSTSVSGWGKQIYTIPNIDYNTITVSGTAFCGPITPPTSTSYGAVGFDLFVDGIYALSTALYHNDQNVHLTLAPVQLDGIAGSNITIALSSPSTLLDYTQVCPTPVFDVNDILSLIFI